jgi:hypothetical protein
MTRALQGAAQNGLFTPLLGGANQRVHPYHSRGTRVPFERIAMFDLHVSTALIATQATYNPTASIIGGLIGYILMVVALWPVFTKAGWPGWAAIIPIYNTYVLVKIAGYHGALVILFFIPIANIVMAIIVALGIGRAFGKSGAFSFWLLWVLSIIGYLIIGYGSATYTAPGGRSATASPAVAPAV